MTFRLLVSCLALAVGVVSACGGATETNLRGQRRPPRGVPASAPSLSGVLPYLALSVINSFPVISQRSIASTPGESIPFSGVFRCRSL